MRGTRRHAHRKRQHENESINKGGMQAGWRARGWARLENAVPMQHRTGQGMPTWLPPWASGTSVKIAGRTA